MSRPLSAPKPLPDVNELKLFFRYNPDDGKLFWKELSVADGFSTRKINHHNPRYAGKEAGSMHGGYVRCMLHSVHHMVHRIIWKMIYGDEPVQIDHIDGDRSNNRVENLRNVSHQINAKNRRLYENNKTGVPGVSFHPRDGMWQVRIGVGGKEIHVGSYLTWEEAIAARMAAQKILEYHDNHGKDKV